VDVDHLNAAETDRHRLELRRETYTMALYVSICLLAALAVVSDEREHLVGLVWGTTIGLSLAHWVAFRAAARVVGGGALGRTDAALAAAQIGGAAAIAVVCTVPVVLLSGEGERDAVRLVLVVFLGVTGYAVARSAGATRARSTIYAVGFAALALVVAVVKNTLAGH
jgi:voltage-gated potassium channel Kch